MISLSATQKYLTNCFRLSFQVFILRVVCTHLWAHLSFLTPKNFHEKEFNRSLCFFPNISFLLRIFPRPSSYGQSRVFFERFINVLIYFISSHASVEFKCSKNPYHALAATLTYITATFEQI